MNTLSYVVEINETEGITFDECDIFFIGGEVIENKH